MTNILDVKHLGVTWKRVTVKVRVTNWWHCKTLSWPSRKKWKVCNSRRFRFLWMDQEWHYHSYLLLYLLKIMKILKNSYSEFAIIFEKCPVQWCWMQFTQSNWIQFGFAFSNWWWFIRPKSFLHRKKLFFIHPQWMMASLSITK